MPSGSACSGARRRVAADIYWRMLRRVNLYDIELEHDEEPQGYGADYCRIEPLVEADETNLNLILLEPGQAVCPYHYEYAEEWLLVLEGEVVVRTGACQVE